MPDTINSGECFNCSVIGHIGSHCPTPPDQCLHRQEQLWRAVCANVLRELTDIRLVSTSDYGTVEEVEDVEGEDDRFFRQGNGGGSLE